MPTPRVAQRSGSSPPSPATRAKRHADREEGGDERRRRRARAPIPAHRGQRSRAAPPTPTTPARIAVSVRPNEPAVRLRRDRGDEQCGAARRRARSTRAARASDSAFHTIAPRRASTPAPGHDRRELARLDSGIEAERAGPSRARLRTRMIADGVLRPAASAIGATTHPMAASSVADDDEPGAHVIRHGDDARGDGQGEAREPRDPLGARPGLGRRGRAATSRGRAAQRARPASGRLTSSTASTSAKASAPPAARVAPRSAVHRVAVPNGSRCSAAAARWISDHAAERDRDDERLVERGDDGQRRARERDRRDQTRRTTSPAENAAGRIRSARRACGPRAPRMNPNAEKYATPTSSSSQAVPAGAGRARPTATIAERDDGDDRARERGNPNASRRRPCEGQGHARPRRSRRPCRGRGDVRRRPRTPSTLATTAGTTSPSVRPATTAIVASACRRSQTRTPAKRSSPTAGRQRRTPRSERTPAGERARTTAPASRRRTPPTRGAGAVLRERDSRGARLGDAARLGAGRSGAGPAAGHGCPGETERDHGEHRPAEVRRALRRRPRRSPSPARRRRRSDARACGSAGGEASASGVPPDARARRPRRGERRRPRRRTHRRGGRRRARRRRLRRRRPVGRPSRSRSRRLSRSRRSRGTLRRARAAPQRRGTAAQRSRVRARATTARRTQQQRGADDPEHRLADRGRDRALSGGFERAAPRARSRKRPYDDDREAGAACGVQPQDAAAASGRERHPLHEHQPRARIRPRRRMRRRSRTGR